MSKPQARMGDIVLCTTGIMTPVGVPAPGPQAILPPCMPTTLVGNKPAARVSDMHASVTGPHPHALCSTTVLIGNVPATRLGDTAGCGGATILGEFTVLTGG